MKLNFIKKLVTTIFVVFAANIAFAYDFEVDGIYYEVISASKLTCMVVKGYQKYNEDIIIPAEVSYRNRTLKVTKIGESAFANCSSLTSVEIPSSVIEIGRYAFYNCSSLKSIEIPNSVNEIESGVFSNCSSLKSVEIPNSVRAIRAEAFSGCSSLINIEIPNSVRYLGDTSFRNCTSLKSIKLSDTLQEIKYGTFENCESLESIIIPASIEKIEQYYIPRLDSTNPIFGNCSNLKTIRFEHSGTQLIFGYFGALSGSNNLEFHVCKAQNWTNTLETIFIDRRVYPSIEYLESLKEVVIGENLRGLDIELKNAKKLTTITSYSTVPPTIPPGTNSQYMYVKVRVPNEALEAYRQANGWKNFWDLEGFDATSKIDEIQTATEKTEIARYNVLGAPVSEDYEGIVIVRYSDGSTKKFMNRK